MGLVDSIIGAESGGNPNATNSNSSASGPGQFINSTFLDVIRRARPDLAGLPDDQLLALKTDPTIGRQATEAYAQQNQAALANAGVPVTPGTTYLAHFAGPGGAIKVLQADPDASVGDILGPAVVKANPFLEGMTAQDLQAWAAKKMGAALPQPGVQSVPVASPSPANSALAANTQQPPIFPQTPVAGASSPIPQIPTFAQPQAPPIFYAQRRPIDLSKLQAALSQGPFFFGRNS